MKVHKYLNDDPTAKYTACGLSIRWSLLDDRHLDVDARKTTCGNCQRARTGKTATP